MTATTLKELEHHDEFIARHIGPDDGDIAAMLKVVGANSLDDMIGKIAPASILQKESARASRQRCRNAKR